MKEAPVTGAFPEFGLFADLDDAVVAADERGIVVFANEAAEALLGWAIPDLLGASVDVFVPEHLLENHRRGLERFASGEPMRFTGQPLRLPARCKDGTELEIDLVLSALELGGHRVAVATLRTVDADDGFHDPSAVADELIEMLKASEVFSVAMNRLVATLGRRLGFDAAVLWVPDVRIARLRCVALWETAPGAFPNFAGETRSLTLRADEGLAGRTWTSGVPVWSDDLAAEERFLRADSARADGLKGGIVFPVLADHEVVGVVELFAIHPRALDVGLQRGLLRVGVKLGQVLERRLTDELAKLERARLELALDAGDMGTWHWDFAGNVVTWSENMTTILGRSGDFTGTIDDFAAFLHRDDRERVLLAFRRAIEPGAEPDLRLEYRVVTDDGESRWMEARGRILTDDRGEPIMMTGVASDITERKHAEFARETAHARLDLALEAGQMGVWDWDLELDEVRNSVPLQLEFGFPPRATFNEMLAHIHPEDREIVRQQMDRAVRETGRFQVEVRVVVPDGQVRWVATRGVGILDAQGRVASFTGVATDVTGQRAAQARLRRKNRLLVTLNELGRAVTSHLDLGGVVQMVADAATEITGARVGAFFTVEEPGGAPRLRALSGSGSGDFPMPRDHEIFTQAIGTGDVVRLDDVTSDPRYGDGARRGPSALRSVLVVPVVGGGGEVVGVLAFGHPDRSRFTEDSESLAIGVAAQAAVAMNNAQLFAVTHEESTARQRAYEERDAVALALQSSLLPPALPQSSDFRFGGRYLAGHEMVGGDFYDVFPLGGRDWGLVMGDVCGKGPGAAAVTALARYTVRSAAVVESEPRDVLRFLNDAALRDPTVDRFCSAVYARLHVLHRGLATLQFAHGGHPPALVLRNDGGVQPAEATGMLLGVVDEPAIAQQATTLDAGDAVVLYTDGVTEARGRGGSFGLEHLMELIASLAGHAPQVIADTVAEAARAHVTRDRHDDIAVLVASVLGP